MIRKLFRRIFRRRIVEEEREPDRPKVLDDLEEEKRRLIQAEENQLEIARLESSVEQLKGRVYTYFGFSPEKVKDFLKEIHKYHARSPVKPVKEFYYISTKQLEEERERLFSAESSTEEIERLKSEKEYWKNRTTRLVGKQFNADRGRVGLAEDAELLQKATGIGQLELYLLIGERFMDNRLYDEARLALDVVSERLPGLEQFATRKVDAARKVDNLKKGIRDSVTKNPRLSEKDKDIIRRDLDLVERDGGDYLVINVDNPVVAKYKNLRKRLEEH